MGWTTNPIMEWFDPRPASPTFNTWVQISDHGRSPLSVTIERIENKQRMANGRLRRYVVAKKRSWACSWDNFPDKTTSFLTNGEAGIWMETFHNQVDGEFRMRIRSGNDRDTNLGNDNGTIASVIISDFSKDIVKRGIGYDLWSMNITLEEV